MRIDVLIVALTLSCGTASAGETIVSGQLPPIGSPATSPWPPCSSTASAPDVLDKIATEADAAIGKPVVSSAFTSPAIRNWVGERLGVNNGSSMCQTLCISTPSSFKVKYQSGFRIIENNGNPGGMWYNPSTTEDIKALNVNHNWGATTNATTASSGSVKVTCLTGMNWSHNQARDFSLRAVWP